MKNNSKTKKHFRYGWGLLIILVGIAAAWWRFFSDYSNSGVLSTNDSVNLAFFALFAVLTGLACWCLEKINALINDFHRAESYLKIQQELGADIDDEAVLACFKDKKVKELFQEYQREKDRIRTRQPSGFIRPLEDYFDLANFSDYLKTDMMNQLSGIFTGLGMLGTFVGLMLGMKDLNVGMTLLTESVSDTATAVDTSVIQQLMACIGVAFVTSITGLMISIVYNLFYSLHSKALGESIEAFLDRYEITDSYEHNVLNRILGNQKEQRNATEKSANTIGKAIASCLAPQMQRMEDTYKLSCKLLKEAQSEALKSMVEEFHTMMVGSVEESVTKLAEAVNVACDYQEQATEKIKQNIEAINTLSDNTVEINRISAQTVEQLKGYTQNLDANIKDMMAQVSINNDTVLKNNEAMNNAISQLQQLETLTDKMTQIATVYGESITELQGTSAGLGAAAGSLDEIMKSLAAMKDKLQESAETLTGNAVAISGAFVEHAGLLEAIRSGMVDSEKKAKTDFAKLIEKQEGVIQSEEQQLEEARKKLASVLKGAKEDIADEVKSLIQASDDKEKAEQVAISEGLKPVQKLSEEMDTVKDGLDDIREKLDNLQRQLDEYQK